MNLLFDLFLFNHLIFYSNSWMGLAGSNTGLDRIAEVRLLLARCPVVSIRAHTHMYL